MNAGLELSVLGTGCWSFGGGEYRGDQNQRDVNDVVCASFDMLFSLKIHIHSHSVFSSVHVAVIPVLFVIVNFVTEGKLHYP